MVILERRYVRKRQRTILALRRLALPRSTPTPTRPQDTEEGVKGTLRPNPTSLDKRALHNRQAPSGPLSLSKERVRERSHGRLLQPARNDCGTTEFRLTSAAARDARGDLSLVKERFQRRCASLRKALLEKERESEKAIGGPRASDLSNASLLSEPSPASFAGESVGEGPLLSARASLERAIWISAAKGPARENAVSMLIGVHQGAACPSAAAARAPKSEASRECQ
jgi:hypothetical protein